MKKTFKVFQPETWEVTICSDEYNSQSHVAFLSGDVAPFSVTLSPWYDAESAMEEAEKWLRRRGRVRAVKQGK